jgi:hypothetical protein
VRDSATGFDRAPDRYSAKGRETVDRMRDEAHSAAIELLNEIGAEPDLDIPVEAIARLMFAYACRTHELKYEDREGLKDDPEQERKKAKWWRQMAAHVRGEGPDPRHERPGFVPYVRS